MTKLLKQAIAQIRELPEDQQDAIAVNLMFLVSDVLTGSDDQLVGVRLRRRALVNGAASRLRPSGFDR